MPDDRPTQDWNDPRLVGLRQRIQALKHEDIRARRGRPLMVELSGTPKSGKSTTIGAVGHFFHRMGLRVASPTEGASKRTPPSLKEDLAAFNTWSACYALMHMLEARHDPAKYDLVILDRGLFDSLVWFQMLHARGEVDADTLQTVHRFLLEPRWRGDIDLVCLFTTDPATAMYRENHGKLIDKRGRMMNENSLDELNTAYFAVQDQCAEEFNNFLLVDTSPGGLNQLDAAIDVAETVVALLEVG